MKFMKTALWTSAALGLALVVTAPANADQVILDDLIVQGSICAGLDCVNGESFGFDTLRLKENNLRIKFQDTSSSASFPTRDWQITANESSNGGLNKFSIDDIDGGRTPFTIEGGAPSHSLYVDDGGRIGLGTSTPVVEVHIKDGDTPTLRLEQDGSSGFTPQTWDVAGNETNFFVRDATGGSTLPFRIQPTAPSNSIYVSTDGDIGIGTSSPVSGTDMHVLNSSGAADITVQSTSGNAGFSLQAANGDYWITNHVNSNENYQINRSGDADVEFILGNDGDLTLAGEIITNNCPAGCGPADFVFEPDYDLMPLPELAEFVTREKHLPNIPSAEEMSEGVKVTWMQMRLLEKVEELVLYTIDQQKLIDELTVRLEGMDDSVEQ